MRKHRKSEGRWERSPECLFGDVELCFSRDREADSPAFLVKGILLKGRVLKSPSSFPAPGPHAPGLAGQCILRYPGMQVLEWTSCRERQLPWPQAFQRSSLTAGDVTGSVDMASRLSGDVPQCRLRRRNLGALGKSAGRGS